MNGAREYASLFSSGRYGNLRTESGSHARGKYFHIYIIDESGKEVEVYGILGGHPGWTEYYGWIHKGKWCEDFYKLVEEKKKVLATRKEIQEKEAKLKAEAEKEKTQRILLNYASGAHP